MLLRMTSRKLKHCDNKLVLVYKVHSDINKAATNPWKMPGVLA